MHWVDNMMQEKRYSLFWMPLGMTAVFGTIMVGCLFWVNAPYKFHTFVCVMLALLGWGGLLAWDQKNILSNVSGKQSFIRIRMLVYVGFAVIVAWVMACTVWRSYLSLNPAWAIDNGVIHKDTLFFSTIAEGYRTSDCAKILIAEEPNIKYHTFSIFIMHLLTIITGIPAFFVYNYLYPLLFFPLYAFLLLKVISETKMLFLKDRLLSGIDVAMTSFMIIGFLPYPIMTKMGILKSSTFISESFLFSVILSLIFFIVSVRTLLSQNSILKKVFCLLVIPIAIILISASKISVGFIITGAICYYFWRIKKRGSFAWWMAFFYLGVFWVCLKTFNSGSGNVGNFWEIFAFQHYCSGWIGYLGHNLYLLIPVVLFFVGMVVQGKSRLEDIRQGKVIWMEIVGVITMLGLIPDAFLALPGGAAAYFSLFVEIPGVVLLCANNFFVGYKSKTQWIWLENVLLFWCIVILMASKNLLPANREILQNIHQTNLYEEMSEIQRMVDGHEKEYVIFLESDAAISKIYKIPHAKIFVYPALTGCSVINAAYFHDGRTYNYVDEPVPYYGMAGVKQEKITLPQAIEKARHRGKRYLIDISSLRYDIISLQEAS